MLGYQDHTTWLFLEFFPNCKAAWQMFEKIPVLKNKRRGVENLKVENILGVNNKIQLPRSVLTENKNKLKIIRLYFSCDAINDDDEYLLTNTL